MDMGNLNKGLRDQTSAKWDDQQLVVTAASMTENPQAEFSLRQSFPDCEHTVYRNHSRE
ncbi:MAG: hypothetical protein NT138_11845 [Planctomycetales bacterium]|jgi:hypothetical protein|nr:hypothetical protein [Planctomycetales bacterium]